ncbi:aminoacyl-tRNA deacylase [Lysobacter korlensis]|uniref:Aminoacyl-tRNA deacylase n=1 Tax=Lysobacter korlensis TaxID=553636 RepID=A0ABV6RI29_9GAMM
MLSPRLHSFLDETHSHYTTLHHERTVTAPHTAEAVRVPRQQFAKTVMLKVDGALAMYVMPSNFHADLHRIALALAGANVELAHEDEFRGLFPDCEPGAMPPFGNLYGVPVYVDSRLTEQDRITFNAGTHTDAVRMPYAEFEQLVQPQVLWLTHMM